MTRFAWLQARTQTLVALAALAALALTAAITGIRLSHLYSDLVAHCTTGCDLATSRFLSHDAFLQSGLNLLVRLLPPVFGIFWGAPLVARELETGTYRLAWTQTVTRRRWLAVKLATGALATVVVMGLLMLAVTWWYRAPDAAGTNRFDVFDARDVAPIGYALFAFAAGALIGAVLRRTLPAMAVTLGVVVFARIATMLWLRPHLLPPRHVTTTLAQAGGFGFTARAGGAVEMVAKGGAPDGSWTLSSRLVTSTGQRPTSAQITAFVQHYCPAVLQQPSVPAGPGSHKVLAPPGAAQAFDSCRTQAARTFRLRVVYQPSGHFWPLQWLEAGVFTGLAVLCAVACYGWVSRRI